MDGRGFDQGADEEMVAISVDSYLAHPMPSFPAIYTPTSKGEPPTPHTGTHWMGEYGAQVPQRSTRARVEHAPLVSPRPGKTSDFLADRNSRLPPLDGKRLASPRGVDVCPALSHSVEHTHQYTPPGASGGTDRPKPHGGGSGSLRQTSEPRMDDAVKGAPAVEEKGGGAVTLELQAEAVVEGDSGAAHLQDGLGSRGAVMPERGPAVNAHREGSVMAASVRPGTVAGRGSPSDSRLEEDGILAGHGAEMQLEGSSVRCGYLEARRGVGCFGGWVKRFFSLTPGRFRIFLSEGDYAAARPPAAEIEVGTSLSVKRDRHTDVQFTLFLQKAGRLSLRVADPEETDDWIRAFLDTALGEAPLGTGARAGTAPPPVLIATVGVAEVARWSNLTNKTGPTRSGFTAMIPKQVWAPGAGTPAPPLNADVGKHG